MKQRCTVAAISLILALYGWLKSLFLPPTHARTPFYPAKRSEVGNGAPSVKHHSRRKPEWVKHKVIYLKAIMPRLSCRELATTFNRLHAEDSVSVGKTYVSDIMRQHRYAIILQRRELKRRIPRSQPRNLTWAIDCTGKGDSSGEQHVILGLIDHGSRRCLRLTALARRNSLTLLGHLLIAIGLHGKPKRLRSDNEAIFTSHLFRAGLRLLGIQHQTTTPGCPWQNGRIERLFGTLKQVLDPVRIASADQLQYVLVQFSFWYNHVRPHQHLQGRTPAEAWQGLQLTSPIREVVPVSLLGDTLTGYWLRR